MDEDMFMYAINQKEMIIVSGECGIAWVKTVIASSFEEFEIVELN